jgi:selenoprotein W-related protein
MIGIVDDVSSAVTITYCTQCNWLMRAAWMAQELLSTFSTELSGLTLVPGTGGVFRVSAGGVEVWNRATDGGFPDIVELKRRVRDQVAPERQLGHADRAAARATEER